MDRIYKRYVTVPVPGRTRRRNRRASLLRISQSIVRDHEQNAIVQEPSNTLWSTSDESLQVLAQPTTNVIEPLNGVRQASSSMQSLDQNFELDNDSSGESIYDINWPNTSSDEETSNSSSKTDIQCNTDSEEEYPSEDIGDDTSSDCMSSSGDESFEMISSDIASDNASTTGSDHGLDNNDSVSGVLFPSEENVNHFENVSDENVFEPTPVVSENSQVVEDIREGELRDQICQCSETTQGEVLVMVLSLGLRHSLSYKAMVDVLSLINNVFKREVLPATFYHLLKHTKPKKSREHIHPLCPECNDYIRQAGNVSGNEQVQCDCGYLLASPQKAKNIVLSLGMKEQVRELFENSEVAKSLNYRFERKKFNASALEDVMDGALYRKMSGEGMPLSDRNNFSYSFNTDGVPFGKTSHQQMWPIYITVNELPPKLRAKHMLLVGIWVGKSEPNMQVILQPFVHEANELSTEGLDWNHNGETVHSKLIPLFCVVDSQARWRVLNHKSPEGYYSCTLCEHPGEHTCRGVRFGMMLDTFPVERTDRSLRDCMFRGYLRRNLPYKRRHFKGSRGPCAIINLHYFNLCCGVPPDSMHFIKGIVEQNLNLILSKLDYDDVEKISNRLIALQPPSSLTRLPRSLKYREKFTASEHRAFLLIYGLPSMHGIVSNQLLSHFALLSGAMFLLMQKSITHAQITYAGKLLLLYVTLYERFYGTEHMTFNIHLLTHCVSAVINLGPSWTHTCYPYEGKNRYLLQLAKSPLEVAKGVARRYSIFNNLPNLCDKFRVSDEILNFCNSMFFKPLRSIVRSEGVVLIGRGLPYTLSEEEEYALSLVSDYDTRGRILQFQRVILKGFRVTSKDYHQSFRRDDSGIYLDTGEKCRVSNIITIMKEPQSIPIIFAHRMLEMKEPLWKVNGLTVGHITRVKRVGQLLALKPSEICGQCVFLSTDNGTYVTNFPYGCRGD